MHWDNSGTHLKATTMEKPGTNRLPSKRITPLYNEILKILVSFKGGLSMTELSKKVTLTKHSSRIRMALDALREQGLVDEPMDVTPKYKASCVKAHKSLMLH